MATEYENPPISETFAEDVPKGGLALTLNGSDEMVLAQAGNGDVVYGFSKTAVPNGEDGSVDTASKVREVWMSGSGDKGDRLMPAADGRLQKHDGTTGETYAATAEESWEDGDQIIVRPHKDRTRAAS